VALFAEHKSDIALVLTDMVMPFMDGPATIRALRKMDAQVKIIAASGLSTTRGRDDSLEGIHAFLTKPYTAERLLKALAEVLKNS
jgi:CheY-like chemotaxis protein